MSISFFWKCFKSPGKDNNQAPVTRQMRASTRFPTLHNQSSPASTPICTSSQFRAQSHKTGQPGHSLHTSALLLRLPFNHMESDGSSLSNIHICQFTPMHFLRLLLRCHAWPFDPAFHHDMLSFTVWMSPLDPKKHFKESEVCCLKAVFPLNLRWIGFFFFFLSFFFF